ncbi:hypothetical protein GJAV_G00170140 [Gymnothorax javanicus]|nr:hypothetical protein GJAV_G00170140 [Gymnothorax javanicus]
MEKQRAATDTAISRTGDGSSLLDLDTGFVYPGSCMSIPSLELHQSLQGLTVLPGVLSSTPREGEESKPALDCLQDLSLIDLMSPCWTRPSWKVSPFKCSPSSPFLSHLCLSPSVHPPSC